MRNVLWLAGTSLILTGTLAAQQPAPDGGASLRRSFEEVSGWVATAAERVPADKYAFKPIGTVRTFGQLVGHIADGQNYYCAQAAGSPVEWSTPVESGSQEKAVLIAKLKESTARCAAVHAKGSVAQGAIANYGHTSLHYGNIITYMRLMGLVPPSS
jgi:uncharacterized damage-inducible protein DinB